MSADGTAAVVRAVSFIQPGTVFTADHIRDAVEAAGVRQAELKAGLYGAARLGYITMLRHPVTGDVCHRPSAVPSRKGGYNAVWVRTDEPIQVQP